MMKLIGALLFFLSIPALAQDYTIVRFEASDYRSFTFDEMSVLLGDNQKLIPELKCNGRDELDPFTPALRMNPLRNSLKIKVPKEEKYYTYMLGELFDELGNTVSPQETFVKKSLKTLKRFETLPSTSKLLRQLEESFFPLVIALGNNSFNPQIEGGKFWSGIRRAQAIAFLSSLRMSDKGHPFDDIGVGGQILWNPDLKIDTIESDGVRRNLDPDVALGHEMYHAFDSIRGMLDMGNISGPDLEFQSIVEYRGVYFENLLRKDLGLRYRKHYSTPHVLEGAPDLLDDNGEPIFIKSPCL
jgi:hypothetical protein